MDFKTATDFFSLTFGIQTHITDKKCLKKYKKI